MEEEEALRRFQALRARAQRMGISTDGMGCKIERGEAVVTVPLATVERLVRGGPVEPALVG